MKTKMKSSNMKKLLKKEIDKANELIKFQLATQLPISADEARTISDKFTKDYGFAFSDIALKKMQDPKYGCKYILVTNGDNLYSKGFVDDYILNDMKEGKFSCSPTVRI